jgi:hypothetical protein
MEENSKSEYRNPKSETNSKSKIQNPKRGHVSVLDFLLACPFTLFFQLAFPFVFAFVFPLAAIPGKTVN